MTIIKSMTNGTERIEDAIPGGLIGISTDRPRIHQDGRACRQHGRPEGKMPAGMNEFTIKYNKLAPTT